jgi:hypothetical protein
MKKILSVLLILAMARIGFTFLDSSSADVQVTPVANQEDYFFGVKNAQSNFNQVLALLVGRNGTPGPVGVAGRDGLIGVDGTAGPQGLPGAPGAAGQSGRDGAGVIAVSFSGREGSCINGGIRFTDAAGAVSFACNGTPGPAGAPGSQGAQGPQGAAGSGGSGGSQSVGQGDLTLIACDNDIRVRVEKLFNGSDFRLDRVLVSEIANTCAGNELTISIKIISDTAPPSLTLVNGAAGYSFADLIECKATLPGTSDSRWTSGFNFTASDLTCRNETRNTAIAFGNISSADYTNTIGVQLIG